MQKPSRYLKNKCQDKNTNRILFEDSDYFNEELLKLFQKNVFFFNDKRKSEKMNCYKDLKIVINLDKKNNKYTNVIN